jgi:hypothetical protein
LFACYFDSDLLILIINFFEVLKLFCQSLRCSPIICIFRINGYISCMRGLILDNSKFTVVILACERVDVVLDQTTKTLCLVDALT